MLISLLWFVLGLCGSVFVLAITGSFSAELLVTMLLVQWLNRDLESHKVSSIMLGWFFGIELLGTQGFGLALLLGAGLIFLTNYLPKLLQFIAPFLQRMVLLLITALLTTSVLSGFKAIAQEIDTITLIWLLSILIGSLIRQPQTTNQGFDFR